MDAKERFKKIRDVLLYVLIFNLFVAFVKTIYGWITKCASMTADGFHSFSDGTSNVIGLIGIWVASRPVDKTHPYGHKKFETFASVGIGILLVLVSFNIIHDSIRRFINHIAPVVNSASFIIMLVTIAINIGVIIYERIKGKQLNSDILISDALHTQSDVLVSLSVIATLFAIKLGLPTIDVIIALLIACVIGYAAFKILRRCSGILCDEVAVVADRVKGIIMDINTIKGCHNIRTRGRQDDIHVDLHVLVNPEMHVDTAHNLSNVIEKKIKENIVGVSDVIVHIEPTSHLKDERV